MCWVIPPASPAATSVSRIASSSDVLPWSTWPMIVITGGRSTSSSSESSKTGSSSSASAAPTMSTFLSNDSASTVMASSESVWVRVAISPSSISFLITSGEESWSDSATSLTVEPERTCVAGSSACSASSFASASASRSGSTHWGRRLRPRPRRGGWDCCGGPGRSRRLAWESITTRRRRPPPDWPPGPPPSPRPPREGRGPPPRCPHRRRGVRRSAAPPPLGRGPRSARGPPPPPPGPRPLCWRSPPLGRSGCGGGAS